MVPSVEQRSGCVLWIYIFPLPLGLHTVSAHSPALCQGCGSPPGSVSSRALCIDPPVVFPDTLPSCRSCLRWEDESAEVAWPVPSEVLRQPSCILGPELPVCESWVFGRAHIRRSGEAVRQSAADGRVQSSCLAGAGIIISMEIPKGALVAHQ